MPHRNKRQSAFTIIELIVAISITALLLTLIFQIFQTTQQAVSVGLKTGEMMVESETIGTQLERDTGDMVPPSSSGNAGFLVIAQKRLYVDEDGDGSLDSGEGITFNLPNGREITEPVRSDQLIFVRKGDDPIRSLTPESANALSSNASANYARVWYGHVLRTGSDGTTSSSLESGDEPNKYANGFVLGRQALLLADAPSSVSAQSAQWDAQIDPSSYGPNSPSLLHQGVTDVADQVLRNTAGDGVLDEIEDNVDNGSTYPDAVYPFSVPDSRPWLNTSPNTDDNTIRENFEPWRVGQMHMNLASNVSDVIIEFAGDYDNETGDGVPDGKIDKDGDDIKWYSHYPNEPGTGSSYDPAKPATWPIPDSFVDSESASPTDDAYYTHSGTSSPPPATADAAIVWRHDDDAPTDPTDSKWPYLIRIRYRVHDVDGQVQSGVYDPSGGGSWQPIVGQWVEHVIQIRPLP